MDIEYGQGTQNAITLAQRLLPLPLGAKHEFLLHVRVEAIYLIPDVCELKLLTRPLPFNPALTRDPVISTPTRPEFPSALLYAARPFSSTSPSFQVSADTPGEGSLPTTP